MKRSWTKEQALAICDAKGTLLLSAAAGSGKTAVLTERVVRMLTRKKNPVQADRLLIATFSNEAAGELKRRIDDGLSQVIRRHPDNAAYRRQQILLQKADISTISSFCSKMVKEHFQELNLPSDFRIADDGERSALKNAAMEQTLEEQYQSGNRDFTDLIEFICKKDDKRLTEIVDKIYEFIRSLPFEERWLNKQLKQYALDAPVLKTEWGKTIAAYAQDVLQYAQKLLKDAIRLVREEETLARVFKTGYEADLNMLEAAEKILENGDWNPFYFMLRDFSWASARAPKGYGDHPLKVRAEKMKKLAKERIEQLVKQLAGSEEDFIEDRARLYPMIKVLFETVLLFHRHYSENKRERGIVDFSDLEHDALSLLVQETAEDYQRTALAEEMSKEYECLLIDEYQDTNEVQDMIFAALSRDGGNLFMVGDVKQSIYRFRQAMPEIFLQKRQEFSSYDRRHYPATLILGKNFRSRKTVTDVVNYLFRQLMSPELGEIDYNREEELAPAALYPSAETAAEFHVIDKAGEKYSEKDEVYEARYIAGLIDKMLKEGYRVKEGEEMRPCRSGDFCILLRAKKGKTSVYAEALNQLDIPAWADTEGDFLSSKEVSALLSLLQTIDNPLADIPLTAAMLSPLFSFTEDQLADIRLKHPHGAFYLAVVHAAQEGNRGCGEFLEKLFEYRQISAVMQVNRLLEFIIDDTDYLEVLQILPDASQKRSNVRLFCDYAIQYSKAGYAGLSGFLRFIGNIQERGGDMKSAAKSPDGASAVRIMTIHGSKGLEFPICIVADCGKGFNKMDLYQNGILNAELGFAMKTREPDLLKEYTNVPFEAVKLENERLTLSEEMRILYVALTRAKEKLIMTMTTDDLSKEINKLLPALGEEEKLPYYAVRTSNSFGAWLLMAFLRNPDSTALWQRTENNREYTLPCDSEIKMFVVDPPEKKATAQTVEKSFSAPIDDRLYQVLRMQAEHHYLYEEECHLPSKLSVTEIIAKQEETGKIHLSSPRFLQKEDLSGAERGTAVHTFLQFADFSHCMKDLQGELQRMVEKKFLTEQQGKIIDLQKLCAFFASDICQRILEAQHAYREYKFMYEIPAGQLYEDIAGDACILLQGIADCVIEDEDGIVIVDYKTDHVFTPEILVKRYQPQLLLYQEALEKQFGKPVKECVIYSVALEKEIVLPI